MDKVRLEVQRLWNCILMDLAQDILYRGLGYHVLDVQRLFPVIVETGVIGPIRNRLPVATQ